jgi:hypothetical protein
MLRCTQTWLGRWSSRDFLRGRSKRAGAVHTRHTHGRQGRYKRLSTMYSSVRDGRRHSGNHMQGGLGIKLGGGLFGLRIPRQHQLSHMTKEEFDLEVFGHPNITNPYREHLEEHPDLKSVMMNARVAVKMVVLLPRVSRNGDGAGAATTNTVAPVKWRTVAREVGAALQLLDSPASEAKKVSSSSSEAAFLPVEVHFTTLEASACCHWPPHDLAAAKLSLSPSLQKASSPATHLEECVAQLYRSHCRLGQVLKLEKATVRRDQKASGTSSSKVYHESSRFAARPRKRPAAFMGAALKASLDDTSVSRSSVDGGNVAVSAASWSQPLSAAGASLRASKSFTSYVLAHLTGMNLDSVTSSVATRASKSTRGSSPTIHSSTRGLVDVVHCLSATEQPLLRVCIRPTLLCASAARAESVLPTTTAATRRVLKSEIDPNAEVGVWTLPKSPLKELLRWHYNAQDPRAHNHDALPHHRRSLPLLIVVDYSTANDISHAEPVVKPTTSPGSTAGQGGPLCTTLMPRRLSLELETAGFKMVQESSLLSMAESIVEWAPLAQWEKFAQSPALLSPGHAGQTHDGAARASC